MLGPAIMAILAINRSGAGLSRAGLGDVFADLVEEVAEGGGIA